MLDNLPIQLLASGQMLLFNRTARWKEKVLDHRYIRRLRAHPSKTIDILGHSNGSVYYAELKKNIDHLEFIELVSIPELLPDL